MGDNKWIKIIKFYKYKFKNIFFNGCCEICWKRVRVIKEILVNILDIWFIERS